MRKINTRKIRILLATWMLCALVTFVLGGGFATRYVLELSEGEFIAYEEKLNYINSIDILKTNDSYVLSICFNALLAYTHESYDYQIIKTFENNFTGWGTETVSRKKINLECKQTKDAINLLADARAGIKNSTSPYYKLNGTYCKPGIDSAMLTLGCLINPKQKWGRVEIALPKPEYQYTDNSNYRMLLPIAWLVDVLLAPIFIIYYSFLLLMYALWAASGGGIPGMP